VIQLLNFTSLNLIQKELILSWRNHPDIRKWMIDENKITLKDHLYFIDLLATKTDKRYFLVQKESSYLGVIDLTNITVDSAELGIYANPDMRGIGSTLMGALIDYATSQGISKLIANVFPNNVRACHLYKRFNFTETEQAKHNNKRMLTLERVL
jgi:UDP-4-amino-4,6-dideoxy-N-acetyl-beta-L-altrosamine N-acetyltransferase